MIDSRIKTIASLVKKNNRVADIGADHGFLAIELIKSMRAPMVIATEKNIYPFKILERNVNSFGLKNFIEVRLGDGLKILQIGEVDTICIAGMGGNLIKKILVESPKILTSIQQLVLQPMNSSNTIKEWLRLSNWIIDYEDFAEVSGNIYAIISATRSLNTYSKMLRTESRELLEKFLIQRLKKLECVINEMEKSPTARASEKFSSIKQEIKTLREKIHSCHSNSLFPM